MLANAAVDICGVALWNLRGKVGRNKSRSLVSRSFIDSSIPGFPHAVLAYVGGQRMLRKQLCQYLLSKTMLAKMANHIPGIRESGSLTDHL